MSGTLTWRPVKHPVGNSLPYELKRAFVRHFGDGQGGMAPLTLSSMKAGDQAFLAGLEAAEVAGAHELAELLDMHEEIELRVEL